MQLFKKLHNLVDHQSDSLHPVRKGNTTTKSHYSM